MQQQQQNHEEVMTGVLDVAEGITASNDQYHDWYACSDCKSEKVQKSPQEGRQMNKDGVAEKECQWMRRESFDDQELRIEHGNGRQGRRLERDDEEQFGDIWVEQKYRLNK
jgi:hypothetical protein